MDSKKILNLSKLVCSFVPENSHESIYKTFAGYSKDKIYCTLGGLEIMSRSTEEKSTCSADIINSFMLGIMICDIYDNPEFKKIIFDKYFTFLEAQKGENIVNFLEYKNRRLF